MKVYVMSGREIDDRISGREVLLASEIELGTFDDTEIASMQYHLARLKETRAAMTPIDIPDGCQLAVVENGPKPDFSAVKGANGVLHASGIALGQEAMWDNNYRRVAQVVEVK